MSTIELSSCDDIFENADSGAFTDSETPSPTDALPTQEDVSADLRGSREPRQASRPAQPTDASNPVSSTAEITVETDATVEETRDSTVEEKTPAGVSQKAEKPALAPASPAAPTENWAAIQATIERVEQNV